MSASNHAMGIYPVCSRLTWDSDFFGYTIYKIEGWLEDENVIGDVCRDLKHKNAKLLYWCSKKEIKFPLALHTLLADIKIDYSKSTSKESLADKNICSYPEDGNPDHLMFLALASGEYSRFKIDPGFQNKEFEKLYREWLVKSVKREIADDVLVYREEDKILGFVTYSFVPSNNIARIGLIAVNENHRGKKIGKKLLDAVLYETNLKGYEHLHVFTQGTNKSACDFYEKCGFTIADKTFIYHIWLS